MDREQTIINALRVAASVYDADVSTMQGLGQLGLAEQFTAQAKEARQLAAFIENVGLNPLGSNS